MTLFEKISEIANPNRINPERRKKILEIDLIVLNTEQDYHRHKLIEIGEQISAKLKELEELCPTTKK